jgi:hypothetical protein
MFRSSKLKSGETNEANVPREVSAGGRERRETLVRSDFALFFFCFFQNVRVLTFYTKRTQHTHIYIYIYTRIYSTHVCLCRKCQCKKNHIHVSLIPIFSHHFLNDAWIYVLFIYMCVFVVVVVFSTKQKKDVVLKDVRDILRAKGECKFLFRGHINYYDYSK